jgi:hypothetical protein
MPIPDLIQGPYPTMLSLSANPGTLEPLQYRIDADRLVPELRRLDHHVADSSHSTSRRLLCGRIIRYLWGEAKCFRLTYSRGEVPIDGVALTGSILDPHADSLTAHLFIGVKIDDGKDSRLDIAKAKLGIPLVRARIHSTRRQLVKVEDMVCSALTPPRGTTAKRSYSLHPVYLRGSASVLRRLYSERIRPFCTGAIPSAQALPSANQPLICLEAPDGFRSIAAWADSLVCKHPNEWPPLS